MAVGAVHQALIALGDLILGDRLLHVEIFRDLSVFLLDCNVGDGQPLLVAGYIFNLGADVPVNAAGMGRQRGAADLDQQVDLPRGIGFVGCIMVVYLLPAGIEFFRPVAVLAGLPCRSEIFNRGLDGFGVGMKQNGIELAHAGYLRLDVPGGAGTDVALNALYLGVGGIAPGCMLRLHDDMTEFAAEGGGFGELEPLNGGDGHYYYEHYGGGYEEHEHMAAMRIVQVE